MAGEDVAPQKFFIHPDTSRLDYTFYFYAFGNTPPSDLLQHVPHDAVRADILSLGCGDLRDLLYSIVLHGRRDVSCGPVPRQLTFTLNDWEPAIHSRNLVMLQLILDSRNMLELVAADMLDGRMEAMGIRGSSTTSAQAGEETGQAVGETKSTTDSNTCNTKPGSQAEEACSKGLQGGQEHNAPFAQRVGVIFSAMYNVFVDADVLQTIQDVAGRLAEAAASSEEWKSTELGRLVHFADDRSQARVCDIFTLYADKRLQERVSAASVEKQRSADISKRFSKEDTVVSGAMGLASLRQKVTLEAYSEMAHKYLKEGVLDPFPLLLEIEEAPLQRAPCNLVNPLLLVTETKGIGFALHYAAFPLDAFHTEVTSWKLRDESTQDEHGKLAPSVLRQRRLDTHSCEVGSTTASARKGVQDAWLGAALEQLAQMCGGFLAATLTVPSEPSASIASAAPHLRININVADAIDFCDSILAASMTQGVPEGGAGFGVSCSGSAEFKGIAFQQGTLQPLRLRKDTFLGSRPEFDVINTSNLADHLGTVDLLVASAPLLKQQPHAALLMGFMASAGKLRLFKDTAALFKKLFCMSSQAAAILIGVVPVSSLSSVEGHADTTSLVVPMGSKLSSKDLEASAGCPRILRVTWKQPAPAFAATTSPSGPAPILGDISPSEFVNLTLPVYNAMVNHKPGASNIVSDLTWETALEISNEAYVNSAMKYYTTASFGRLLALAGRRLRLQTEHFESVLGILDSASYIASAPNRLGEQMALFHALGLAPIRICSAYPPGIRRVVLLVPQSGLGLLRSLNNPDISMCLSTQNDDNHCTSVHMAFVRVRRGGGEFGDDGNDWNSLSRHLEVRDTREDDADAELMLSVIVPAALLAISLQLAPSPMIQVLLRQQGNEMSQLLQGGIGGLSRPSWEVLYHADLANTDRTAILTPDRPSWPWKGSSSSPPLSFPEQAVSSRCKQGTPVSSVPGGSDTPESPFRQRFVHGKSLIYQSLELMSQSGCEGGAPLAGRVELVMANREAREHLDDGEVPRVEATLDPCSVRVILGKELVHIARFPFPVMSNDVGVEYIKSQGYAYFTVLPLEGLLEVPFSLTACSLREDGWRTLLSTFCWPVCVPLASLPRLDFNAEWAHHEVMGPMSAHNADLSTQEKASRRSVGGPHLGFRGMKASLLDIATTVCATHNEDTPIWKHKWVCITNIQRLAKPALWVWVNEILLDPSNQALVLDCCIMPVDRMSHDASLQLGAAIGDAAIHFIQACQEEFDLWVALLPVAVERARQTYAHASDCLYLIPSDAVPSDACPTVCSCGTGKDLPPAFMESMKSVNAMAGGAALTTLVYRAALSPLYAPPEVASSKGSKTTVGMPPAGVTVGCAKCGKGGSSLRCSRCRKVRYCSKQCQRQDWKNPKPKCAASPGSGET